MNELERIDAAAEALRGRFPAAPDRAVILGSGLGAFAGRLADACAVPYTEIDGFPKPTVEGHRGEMIVGSLGEVPVLAMAGRFHYYEGHDMATVAFPVRVLARMGVMKILVTNAAGGVNEDFRPGDLMLITDHINLTGQSPLRGDNIPEFGPRFPDMSSVYDPEYRALAGRIAHQNGFSLREGVYAWCVGPSYETPAEVRMLRALGADAVGMSTVPEAVAARHAGLKVAAVSLITNMAAGILDKPLTHREVIETADEAAPRFEALAEGMLKGM